MASLTYPILRESEAYELGRATAELGRPLLSQLRFELRYGTQPRFTYHYYLRGWNAAK